MTYTDAVNKMEHIILTSGLVGDKRTTIQKLSELIDAIQEENS